MNGRCRRLPKPSRRAHRGPCPDRAALLLPFSRRPGRYGMDSCAARGPLRLADGRPGPAGRRRLGGGRLDSPHDKILISAPVAVALGRSGCLALWAVWLLHGAAKLLVFRLGGPAGDGGARESAARQEPRTVRCNSAPLLLCSGPTELGAPPGRPAWRGPSGPGWWLFWPFDLAGAEFGAGLTQASKGRAVSTEIRCGSCAQGVVVGVARRQAPCRHRTPADAGQLPLQRCTSEEVGFRRGGGCCGPWVKPAG